VWKGIKKKIMGYKKKKKRGGSPKPPPPPPPPHTHTHTHTCTHMVYRFWDLLRNKQ